MFGVMECYSSAHLQLCLTDGRCRQGCACPGSQERGGFQFARPQWVLLLHVSEVTWASGGRADLSFKDTRLHGVASRIELVVELGFVE